MRTETRIANDIQRDATPAPPPIAATRPKSTRRTPVTFAKALPDGALRVTPIGIYHSAAAYPYDVPRQGVLAGDTTGVIEMRPHCGFEQALENLADFSHLWILFWFNRNDTWRPKIQPPRHRDRKVGVFASRSPYRPNPLGMSAVRLVQINGLQLTISGADLLDGTPVLDIKPYLAYADAFPDTSPGWTAQGDERTRAVVFSQTAERQLAWLESHGLTTLRAFIQDHLALEPENPKRHRLIRTENQLLLAYRTWRAMFTVVSDHVTVEEIQSGYAEDERMDTASDPYGDKALHRAFVEEFGVEIR